MEIERADARPVFVPPPPPAEAKPTLSGSAHARAQVAQLQTALLGGTPLQEYQIRALIMAIDDVRTDIDRDRKAQPGAAIDWTAEEDERLVQAASDILFESQLERFIALVRSKRRQ